MDIRRAFAASAYLLVLTGILSLSIAEGSPAIILLATLLCFAAYWTAERMQSPIGRLGTNLGVAAVIVLTPADYVLVTGDAVITATHFLLAVQIVKLFGTKAPRDYLQLFAVSLIHLGVAAVITVELLFSVAFVIYLVVATWTLCLFLLHRELEENARAETGKIRSGRGLLGSTALASIAALALTIIVFFVFPRFSAVIFDIKRGRQAGRTSGFTSEIGLTDLSEIRLNPETVLNVTPLGMGDRFPAEPKWRGFAFDRYEAGKWSRSWLRESATRPEMRALASADRGDPRSGNWTIRRGGRATAPAEAYATYKILQAPLGLDSSVLFGVPSVERVEFPYPEKPEILLVDKGDAVLGIGLKPIEVMYIVRSLPSRREAARTADVDLDQGPLGARIDWLQLPSSPTLPVRLGALASEVIADARAKTAYEKCEALERHLSTRYSYTLELTPAPKGEDPILHFLFTTREGHCELSATAFVLMCRTQGIPARLVNGFQTGQWNEYGGYWQVRQMEAHAWAEVKFAGEAGWIDFDPTPWAGPGGGGVLSSLEKLQDYLRMRWLSYVVSWSQSDQLSAAEKARKQLNEWRDAIVARLKSLRDWVPRVSKDDLSRKLYFVAAGLAVGFALLWFFVGRRGPGGKRAVKPRVTRRVPFFEEWTRALEKRGFRRRIDETPLELARRAEKDGGAPLRGSARLVEVFYRVRFAEDELTPAERTLVDGLIASAAGRNPAPVR